MPIPSLLVSSDPHHILKRIRYRLVAFDAESEADRPELFSLAHMRAYVQLQPVVYQNSKVTKMHNFLPLHLFSQRTTYALFAEACASEFFVFFPWFLVVSALTFREHSTKTRCSILETDFWLLWLYQVLFFTGHVPPTL
jgi:hypothetical protein